MSSPPPPTTTTTTTTTATDYFKSRQKPINHQTLYNNPQQQQQPFPPPTQQRQQQPQQQPFSRTHQQQTYPSGSRGFLDRPGYTFRPFGYSNSEHLQQTHVGGGGGMMSLGVSGSANQKAVGQSSGADDSILKNLREKNGDDAFVIIRDRKVPVSEGASVYAQCRSWLKNGVTVENQPQYVDCAKSLPKPLPKVIPINEDDTEMEESQNTQDVENLSAKELMQLHVTHAKKVRAKLRNQRLQKIERYKDRLALLLPPVADPQPKSGPAS